MAKFETQLVMRPLDNGRRWQLQAPLVYTSDIPGVGTITVPAMFECDLNSMPRLAWIVAPKTDYPEAGAVHDWGYRGNLERGVADAVYREALGVLGMGSVRRGNRWLMLRIFGVFSYKG